MVRLNRIQDARNLYRESMRRQEAFIVLGTAQAASELRARRITLFCKQGYLALEMKDLAAAEDYFKQALEFTIGGMRELEARIRIGLAQVYLKRNQHESAEHEIQACLTLTASGEFPDLEWQANSLKGTRLRQAGDTAKALAYFKRAIQILTEMRQHISVTDLKQSFFTRRFDPYQEVVSLLYHSQKDKTEALQYVDLAKSMTLKEYLGRHQDYFGQNSQIPSWSETTSVSEVLPSQVAMVEYFLSVNELLIFVSRRNRAEGFSVRVPSAELEQQVRKYLQCMKSKDETSLDLLSRKLHDQLVAPVLSFLDLQRVETLVILPDGPLHLLPFGSLKDPGGRYLLEKYALAYAPSRSVFRYCLSLNRGSASSRDQSVLLLDGTANLSGASDELGHLARLYGSRASFVSAKNLASLSRIASESGIIHFAGHAVTSAGKPRLMLEEANGIYLDASMIGALKLSKNRLVSLAGCNTGIGPLADGEMPWGLLPAFLNAGAPAIVVSLLPVDDTSTRKLTSRFYELLVEGSLSKAKALQQAQLSMLNDTHSKTNRLPLYWSPFLLVGDPR